MTRAEALEAMRAALSAEMCRKLDVDPDLRRGFVDHVVAGDATPEQAAEAFVRCEELATAAYRGEVTYEQGGALIDALGRRHARGQRSD